MNVMILLGLATALLLLIGVLIGLGLNGRSQIERDKRQARRQLDLNDRERRLRAELLTRQRGAHGPQEQRAS